MVKFYPLLIYYNPSVITVFYPIFAPRIRNDSYRMFLSWVVLKYSYRKNNLTTKENNNKVSNSIKIIMVNNEIKIGTEVKKVAFVDGNRAINENNIKKHVVSIEKFGRNLVRLLYVDAKDVEGYAIHDAATDEIVEKENYENYIVVLDGQHRFKAAMILAADDTKDFTLDNLRWDKVELEGHSFQEVLIEVNTRTQPWKGSDYISGCVLNDPKNEVALFAKEVTSYGASAKTVNKYLFFEDKFSWSSAMKDSKVLEKAKLQRAQKIWEVVKTYPIGIIKKSLLIDYIISEGGNKHWEGELKNVADLPMDMRHTLEKIRGAETQKQALKKMLS